MCSLENSVFCPSKKYALCICADNYYFYTEENCQYILFNNTILPKGLNTLANHIFWVDDNYFIIASDDNYKSPMLKYNIFYIKSFIHSKQKNIFSIPLFVNDIPAFIKQSCAHPIMRFNMRSTKIEFCYDFNKKSQKQILNHDYKQQIILQFTTRDNYIRPRTLNFLIDIPIFNR